MERGLGKGLDALFGQNVYEKEQKQDEIKISLIEPRAEQPRKSFDREQLQALANSIMEHGVIQPIIVTPAENGYYKIIAGERRWRAAKMAGLSTIPAIVRDFDEITTAEISMIENLQRENLNPIEEALGYQYLMDQFGLTQEKISEKMGKSRPAIANSLRLLALEDEIKNMLIEGTLSNGHARALLGISNKEDRLQIAKMAVEEGLTVRDIEKMQNGNIKKSKKKPGKVKKSYPDVEKSLTSKFGTKVSIKSNGSKGKIEIEYYNEADLTRIVELLK